MVAMEMLQKFTVPGLTWATELARAGKGVQWLSSLTGLLCSFVVESESKCCPEDWELHALWNIWEVPASLRQWDIIFRLLKWQLSVTQMLRLLTSGRL